MASPHNVFKNWPWFFDANSSQRIDRHDGWRGDKKTVYPYLSIKTEAHGYQQNVNNQFAYAAQDALNCTAVQTFLGSGGVPDWAAPAYNQAYERFRKKVLGDRSQIGAAVVEWKESLSMITTRTIGLVNALRSLKRGHVGDFVGYLGLNRPLRKHRTNKAFAASVAKDASGTWLEYWFGWAASLGDVHGAMKALSSPLPYGKGHGTATALYNNSDYFPNYVRTEQHWTIHYRLGGDVLLTNPNLFLLNQLGLVNPASVLLEVTPFSFLLDWATGVGAFLDSFTDWVGVELSNQYMTALLKIRADEISYLDPSIWTGGTQKVTGISMLRLTDIPRPIPNLQIFANVGSSLTRAASSVSLLTQSLHSLKK